MSLPYTSISEHLQSISLHDYSISISNVYDKDVYLATNADKPIGRVITFGNSLHAFTIDLSNKIAKVKHIVGGDNTYHMSDADVVDVVNIINASMLHDSEQSHCNCECHNGALVVHAFPCCKDGHR